MLTTQAMKLSDLRSQWMQVHECAHRYLEWSMQGSFESSQTISDLNDLDIVCLSEETSYAMQCKSHKLAQLQLLDHTIDTLSFVSEKGGVGKSYSSAVLIHWMVEYDRELREAAERLSENEREELVVDLKKARQLLLDECQSTKCAYFRHLEFLRLKKFRAWLRSIRYEMQRLHCCTESFCTGSASELRRGRHFLTVTYRVLALLWSRVVIAVSDPFAASPDTRRCLAGR